MSVSDVTVESIKRFVENTDVKEYINKIREIRMNPTIEQIIDELRKKFRYSGRFFDECYFIPDIHGFFACAECSGIVLDSGIYILADKIARYLEYLKFLEPCILPQYVILHELVHLIIHCLLPKGVRTSYTYAKPEVYFKNLEEAYCEYCATHALKDGILRVFNQNVRIPKEDEFEVALISSLPRPAPYIYFKELVRLRETKGEKEVDNIMRFFISGLTNSQSRFHRQFYSDLAISYVERPFESKIEKVKTKVNLLNKIEPCTAYDLYIVRGEKR